MFSGLIGRRKVGHVGGDGSGFNAPALAGAILTPARWAMESRSPHFG
jgi:hypothetical protein